MGHHCQDPTSNSYQSQSALRTQANSSCAQSKVQKVTKSIRALNCRSQEAQASNLQKKQAKQSRNNMCRNQTESGFNQDQRQVLKERRQSHQNSSDILKKQQILKIRQTGAKRNGQQEGTFGLHQYVNQAFRAAHSKPCLGDFRSKSKNKENMSSIGNSKSEAPSGFIQSGMTKFSKYIKQKKTQILNSNNINVRRNFGSNDSKQGAPAQRKYPAADLFASQMTSNQQQPRKQDPVCSPQFSNFLARN